MQTKKKKYREVIKEAVGKFLALVPVASADITTRAQDAKGVARGDITEIILRVINFALIVLGVLAVLIFIYAGFLYLTASGDEEKLKRAKDVVLYAVIGLAVAVLGFVAVISVQRFIVTG